MSVRAIIVGLLGAVFIATVGYFNDGVSKLTGFATNHFPIIVFGPMIVAILFVNPLLGCLRRPWRLRPGELAVVALMTLTACNLPGKGMLGMWSRVIALPIHHARSSPGWRKVAALSYVPPAMLPNAGRYEQSVAADFTGGLGGPVPAASVPWGKWAGPLAVWVPILQTGSAPPRYTIFR